LFADDKEEATGTKTRITDRKASIIDRKVGASLILKKVIIV